MAELLKSAAWPHEIVGSLRPAKGTSEKQLREALADVELALEGGQTGDLLLSPLHRPLLSVVLAARERRAEAFPSSILLPAAAQRILQREQTTAQPARRAPQAAAKPLANLAAVRTLPLDIAAGPLTPEWARGQAPIRSHGPFLNQRNEAIWIDIFRPIKLVSLLWQQSPHLPAKLLALLPMRTTALPARGGLRLAAGSAWIPTTLLVPARPGNEFIGVKIKGGTLALSGTSQSHDQSIVVSGTWSANLQLTLDVPGAGAAASAAGVGVDAKNAQVGLPATFGLQFASSGLKSIALADSTLKAYGNSATLKRSAGAPFHDAATQSIVVPCDASIDAFAFADQQSKLFECGPEAPIVRSGWSVLTTLTTPDKLGQASGAGALWLELGSGLSAKWNAQPTPIVLAKPKVLLAPNIITIAAQTSVDPVTQDLLLWDEATTDRRSRATFEAPAGTTLYYVSSPQMEGVLVLGRAAAHLDRPVAADGARIAVRMPAAILALVQNSAGTTVYLLGIDAAATQKPFSALALENLLIKVRSPASLWLTGPLDNTGLASGTLSLRFQSYSALPTLPDPYAANFETGLFGGGDAPSGWVSASVAWADPTSALLDFSLETAGAQQTPGAMTTTSKLSFQELALFMLDLSSNADQFGVVVPLQGLAAASLDGVALRAPAGQIGIFTLPPISWEPMLTKQPAPASGDPVLVPAPHDGGAALLQAESVTLVPVAPTPLLLEYVEAVKKEKPFQARLPLPFGIIANINTRTKDSAAESSTFIADGGQFDLHQPAFPDDLLGARQLLMQAPKSNYAGRSPFFPNPSYTNTEDTNNYARGVLSTNIHTRWLEDFGQDRNGVPVERYELTGYGASLFSDWRNDFTLGPAITQARFDVIVGRTSYEVIQMETRMYPWCAKMVRIITIQRMNGGWVLREDSGWLAASPGLFVFPKSADIQELTFQPPVGPAFGNNQIHLGAIRGVLNIRNVRLTAPQFTLPSSAEIIFQPVKFDADVLIDSAIKVVTGGIKFNDGALSGTLVPSREIDGFIQITGVDYGGTVKLKTGPNAGQVVTWIFDEPPGGKHVFELLQLKGPAVAPIACTIEVGGVQGNASLTQRGVQAAVSCNDDSLDPHLVAALRGTPQLPRDGAWSLARMKSTDTAPNALDPQFAAPLVRPTAPAAGSDKWHLADPADIKRLGDSDTPTMIYGLLQSAGTQKLFLARPQAIGGVTQIKVPKPPNFADVAALFNAAGIFPNLGDAFDFDTLTGVDVNAGDIGFDKQFTVKKVGGKPRETLLMDLGVVQIVIRYGNESDQETVVAMKVAPAASPRWSISLKRVAFAVKYKNDYIIKMYADVKADEKSSPTFANLNVHYVGFLQVLQDIFSNVQQVARFLPGGGGAGLKVGFSQGRLTVRNEFALPTLPLGTGQITDVAVAMGIALQLSPLGVEFIAGLGSSEKPFRWVVSPLAGTGVVQVGVNNDGLNVLVQGGLGLGLAIDLGIASGSAAITLALELNTAVDPFMLKAILSGRASVDVMQGLCSATITLAAGLGIIPPPLSSLPPLPPPFPDKLGPYTIGFVASVSVGIHISICWVIDIDWDDYWQFRQDITTPELPVPVPI